MVAPEVGCDAASVIDSGVTSLEDDFARGSIVEVPGVGALVFMHVEDLEPGSVGGMVAEVDGIAVTEAYGIEQLSVVVECCRPPDDFISAVAVDIGHGEVVVAVAIERVAASASLAARCLIGVRLAETVDNGVGGLGA